MSATLTSSPVAVSSSRRGVSRLLTLLPGLLLLFAVGYAGKLAGQWLKALGKAHHWALPNIEYVFWAILFGLVIGHTVGARSWFRAFDPGIATYELLAEGRDRPPRGSLPLRGSRQARRAQPGPRSRRDRGRRGDHDRVRPRLPSRGEAHRAPRDWVVRVRRLGDHRHPRGRSTRTRTTPPSRSRRSSPSARSASPSSRSWVIRST